MDVVHYIFQFKNLFFWSMAIGSGFVVGFAITKAIITFLGAAVLSIIKKKKK